MANKSSQIQLSAQGSGIRVKRGVQMAVSFPELARLKAEFLKLRPAIAKKHLGAAINRSLDPAIVALKQTTPKGPTGNLRRAIAKKVRKYNSGNAVGLVGYRKAASQSTVFSGGTVRRGNAFSYHQFFLEKGTKDRRTKSSSIASSFKRLGPFKIKPVAKRGRLAGLVRVRTTPAYPRAFFKRAPRGQTVYLGSMPIGGNYGEPPVKTAYVRALPEMRAILPREMTISLQAAIRDLADKFPRKPDVKQANFPF